MDFSTLNFCRLCLDITQPNQYLDLKSNNEITEVLRELFPGLKLDLVHSTRICLPCMRQLRFAFLFKRTILCNEAKLESDPNIVKKVLNLCRLCLKQQTNVEGIFLYENTCYSHQLVRTMTEIATIDMNFDIFENPFICPRCWCAVKKIFTFKKSCFKNEEKLRNLVNEKCNTPIRADNQEFVGKEIFRNNTGLLNESFSNGVSKVTKPLEIEKSNCANTASIESELDITLHAREVLTLEDAKENFCNENKNINICNKKLPKVTSDIDVGLFTDANGTYDTKNCIDDNFVVISDSDSDICIIEAQDRVKDTSFKSTVLDTEDNTFKSKIENSEDLEERFIKPRQMDFTIAATSGIKNAKISVAFRVTEAKNTTITPDVIIKNDIKTVNLSEDGKENSYFKEEQEAMNYEVCSDGKQSQLLLLKRVSLEPNTTSATYTCRDKKFYCVSCPYNTAHRNHVLRHYVSKHADSNSIKYFECKFCSYKAKRRDKLGAHVKNVHNSPNNVHKEKKLRKSHCSNVIKSQPKCNKLIQPKPSQLKLEMDEVDSSSSNLGSNIEKHPRVCSVCGVTFQNKKILIRHMKKHEKRIECGECEYVTSKKNLMMLHLNKHRRYSSLGNKCQSCSFEARDPVGLEKHACTCQKDLVKPNDSSAGNGRNLDDVTHNIDTDTRDLDGHVTIHRKGQREANKVKEDNQKKLLNTEGKGGTTNPRFQERSLMVSRNGNTKASIYQCSQSTYSSPSRIHFLEHIRSYKNHSYNKEHMCNICQKRFQSRYNLCVHQKIHLLLS